MASLVLARNNRKFRLVTKGFEYTAKIERYKMFNADVLVIELKPSRKRIGTDIFIQSTKQETESAKNNFLAFNKDYFEIAESIFSSTGKFRSGLFINGMFVAELNSLFSYNITNKSVVGRDRYQLQMDLVKTEVSKLWNSVSEKTAIETLLTSMRNEHLESQINIHPSVSVRHIWTQVIKKVFGKCCFSIGSEHDQVAKDRGYKLLLQTNPGLTNILLICGVKTSDKVITLKGDEKLVQKRFDEKDLSKAGKKRWDKSKSVFAKL